MFNSKTESRKCKRQTPRYNPESRVRTISTMSTLKTTLRKPQPSCRWSAKPIFSESKPRNIHTYIHDLMHKWRTKVYLYGETSSIETNFIDYLRGILQRDTLSLLLFALSVNPLSYLLSKEDGFKLAVGKLKQILSHLFLVDDLKLFTTTRDKLLKLLGIRHNFRMTLEWYLGNQSALINVSKEGNL